MTVSVDLLVTERSLLKLEEIADAALVIDRHMQIDAGDGDVGVAAASRTSANVRPGQRVADECVAAVMNRQGPQAGEAQHLARGQETPPNGVPA
jgi:hypothetical protein